MAMERICRAHDRLQNRVLLDEIIEMIWLAERVWDEALAEARFFKGALEEEKEWNVVAF